MERSSEEASRGRKRSTRSEAKEASSEGSRRRTRSMTSQAAEAKMASEEEWDRILNPESEEDRKILMKFKSEEGKILNLKNELVAAIKARQYPYGDFEVGEYKPAQPAGKKTKKKVVKRLTKMTKAQIDSIRTLAAHPPPTHLTEDQLAQCSRIRQYDYRQNIIVRKAKIAYLDALIAQQEKFGYAVDESEDEVTDNEEDEVTGNEGDNMVENH